MNFKWNEMRKRSLMNHYDTIVSEEALLVWWLLSLVAMVRKPFSTQAWKLGKKLAGTGGEMMQCDQQWKPGRSPCRNSGSGGPSSLCVATQFDIHDRFFWKTGPNSGQRPWSHSFSSQRQIANHNRALEKENRELGGQIATQAEIFRLKDRRPVYDEI